MKELVPKNPREPKGPGLVSRPAAKFAASFAICALAVLCVAFAARVFEKRDQLHKASGEPDNLLLMGAGEGDHAPVGCPWPKFPRDGAQTVHASTLNSVQVLTEGFETGADSTRVLGFYRTQMLARGWRDATEESFSLDPQRFGAKAEAALQDPRFVKLYNKVLEENLVLIQGRWSIQVRATAKMDGQSKTAVSIVAADAPSIAGFGAGLSHAGSLRPGLLNGCSLEYAERLGSEQYSTRLTTAESSATDAFSAALSRLRQQNWRELNLVPPGRSQGAFGWLVRDREIAALCVAPQPGGRGVTVSVTEITRTAP